MRPRLPVPFRNIVKDKTEEESDDEPSEAEVESEPTWFR